MKMNATVSETVVAVEEKEKKIIETFKKLMPNLSDSDKSFLLGLGEGMAIKIERRSA